MKPSKTVCWNAIVKNESAVIKRCMEAMVGQIDYWVVVDTGSTDGTQDIILQFMAEHGIPGELYESPWVDFSHNRSEALQLAENKADFILLCDADMRLAVLDRAWKNQLSSDIPAYSVIQRAATLDYGNIRLINGRLEGDQRYRYWGATHEYCDSIEPSQTSTPRFTGIEMLDFADGGSKADKFERDTQLLTQEIAYLESLEHASDEEKARAWEMGILRRRESLLVRCTFYLAQTYRDSGQHDLALTHYQKRAGMSGWEEETWYALYQSAKLLELLDYSEEEVIKAYLVAYERRPQRAESLYNLARYLRLRSRYALAYVYALAANSIKKTNDSLFVQKEVYQWRSKDELAVSAYWVGQYNLSRELNQELLDDTTIHLSDETRQRLVANIEAADRQLNH